MAPYLPLLRRETLEEKEEVLEKFRNGIKYFEDELKSRGTTFFGGQEHPKMLDYMIWPWFERAEIVPLIDQHLELLPKSDFPLLVNNSVLLQIAILFLGVEPFIFCANSAQ